VFAPSQGGSGWKRDRGSRRNVPLNVIKWRTARGSG
jgi:hypothetical protein